MKVIVLAGVRDFIDALDSHLRADVHQLVFLLQEHGHHLSMPIAKPIGKGLWELRTQGRPAVRILFGFCAGEVVLVYALKKQRPALLSREINLALQRFHAYCS